MLRNRNGITLMVIIVTVFVLIILAGVGIVCKIEADKSEETAKEYLQNNFDTFNIDGSTSMMPLHQALRDKFSSETNEVKHSKTVDAFNKFIEGENDILFGVTFSDELLNEAKNSGINLGQIEITKEAFVFLINKDNPVKSLTEEQLTDIYSGKITNWKDVGGDDARIFPYQRNDDSGSQIRMNKFMGNNKLIAKTYVAEGMGELTLAVAGFNNDFYRSYENNVWYDSRKHAIGYNMYTFTEKQFDSKDVILLKVNNVEPNDNTIFDETYPIVIYNYIYYNKNNEKASEFADNLYTYLMSEEGQQLISDSGYVNLNKRLDRNKNIDENLFFEDDEMSEKWESFYNEEKGEFYDVDSSGKLLIFKNYSDFALHNSEFKDNQNAHQFFTLLYDSGFITSTISIYDDDGAAALGSWWFYQLSDIPRYFHIRFNNEYFADLKYYFNENKYVLVHPEKSNWFDEEVETGYWLGYPLDSIATEDLEITREDLKNLYLRESKGWLDDDSRIEFSDIKYTQKFK